MDTFESTNQDLLLDLSDILNKRDKPILEKPVETDNNLLDEDIRKIIRKNVLTILKGQKYQHHNIKEMQTKLLDSCMSKFITLKPPFPIENLKFITTCTIMQSSLSGFQTASSCFCDEELDRHVIYNHQDDDFFVTVNVFAFAV